MALRPSESSHFFSNWLQNAIAGPDFRDSRYWAAPEDAGTEHKAHEKQLWEEQVEHWQNDESSRDHNGSRPFKCRVWLDTLRAENYMDEIDEYRDKNIADMTVISDLNGIKVAIQGKDHTWRTEWPRVKEKPFRFDYFVPGEQFQLFRLITRGMYRGSGDFRAVLDIESDRVRNCKAVMCTGEHQVFVPWAKSPAEPNDPGWWISRGYLSEPQIRKNDLDRRNKAWRLVVDELISKWLENGCKPLAHVSKTSLNPQEDRDLQMLERMLHAVMEKDDRAGKAARSIHVVTDESHLEVCAQARGTFVLMSPAVAIAPPGSSLTWSHSAVAKLETSTAAEHEPFMDTRSETISRAARPRSLPKRVYDLFLGAPLDGVTRPSMGRYMALSYVWSEWHPTDPTDVLAIAQKAAFQTGIRYVWLDKVCINQNDLSEKEAEVPKMGDYYANAALVLILDRKFDIPEIVLAIIGTLITPLYLQSWAQKCWSSIYASL